MRNTCKIIAVVFFITNLLACSRQTEPLIIASNTWIGYEPLYVAQTLDLVDHPMTLLRQQNATDVMELFAAGKIDVAGLTLDEAMLLIEKGLELHFISVMDISNGADQLVAKRKITNIRQLKGKTVGVETTALGRLVLSNLLRAAQLSLDDINVIDSTVDEHYRLMESGFLDAAITFPPFSEQLKQLDTQTLFDSSQMKEAPIIDVLVVTKQALIKKRAALKSLISGIYTAVELIKNKDPHVLSLVGKNLNLEQSQWATMTEGVELVSPQLNSTFIRRYKLEATMLMLEKVMLQQGLLKNPISKQIKMEMFVRL